MPVFYVLLIIGAVVLWSAIAFLYKPIGGFIKKFFGDPIRIMKDEEKEKNKR